MFLLFCLICSVINPVLCYGAPPLYNKRKKISFKVRVNQKGVQDMLLTTEDGREFELPEEQFKDFELRFGEYELVEVPENWEELLDGLFVEESN